MTIRPSGEAGPLSRSEYLVIEFDPRNASLTVLDSIGYSAANRGDALDNARQAAEVAAANGLPLQYLVIRLAVEATFRLDAK